MTQLNKEQQEQIKKQLDAHNHKRYKVDIILDKDHKLKGFIVNSKVLRPEKMTAIYLTRWLFSNKSLYLGKSVIDMGSGSGIQGIVMGLNGAKQVILTDLSIAAFENSKDNVKRFKLTNKAIVLQGDLFEKVQGKYDLIVFNHPFFSDSTFEELLVSTSRLDRGKLIHRFFDEAKQYLNPEGIIVMPYFHIAGPINDPMIQAPKNGYEVIEEQAINSDSGLQKGKASIYKIQLKK